MGKKNRKRRRPADSDQPARQGGQAPRVLFGIGDADHGYTEGKILRLVQRLQEQSGAHVTALTHDAEVLQALAGS